MMIVTDCYFDGAIWRDGPFRFNGYEDQDDIYNDNAEWEDENRDNLPVNFEFDGNNSCVAYKYLYMYATGGSGFLGATYNNVKLDGVTANYNNSSVDVGVELNRKAHLSETRENKLLFKYSIDMTPFLDEGKNTEDICDNIVLNSNSYTSADVSEIDGSFWDFIPMGPGQAFGVAASNGLYPCPAPINPDDPDEYVCL